MLPGTELVEADVHDPTVLQQHFAGCNVVINLVGVLHEYSRQSFRAVHVELPGKGGGSLPRGRSQASAAYERWVPMPPRDRASICSARARANRKSCRLGSGRDRFQTLDHLWAGRQFLQPVRQHAQACPRAAIGLPNSRFAPVYVGDVAQAFETALENDATIGQSYELCGPRVYTFKELVEDIARMLELKRRVVGLPDSLARLQGKILGLLPVKIFTTDNFLSCRWTASAPATGWKRSASFLVRSSIMPMYFAQQTQRRRYDAFRRTARRG